MMSTTFTELQARDTLTFLTDAGTEFDTATKTLIRAEKYGTARAGDLVVAHTGYIRDTEEFSAATSIYRVTTA